VALPTPVVVDTTLDEEVLSVRVAGELDRSNAHLLPETVLLHLANDDPERVEIDASDVTFCSAAGYDGLVRAVQVTKRRGCDCATSASPAVRRVERVIDGARNGRSP